jgi:hypothetical protein
LISEGKKNASLHWREKFWLFRGPPEPERGYRTTDA